MTHQPSSSSSRNSYSRLRAGFATSLRVLLSVCVCFFSASTVRTSAQVNVYTRSYDNNRSGANLQETILKPSNVGAATFGKLFSVHTDGQIYAQPLYVSHLTIAGGAHNVVFVATMLNSVYAIDADSGTQLWTQNYGPPINPEEVESDHNISWNTGLGILGTPVIDPATKIMYFVAANETKSTSGTDIYQNNLNAIDITTGLPVHGSPIAIEGKYLTADLINPLVFNAKIQNQRPGLALANGNVYIAWASHEDQFAYHGWVMAYSTSTLAQTAVYSDTTTGAYGGIWNAGQAPTVDPSGNIYISTGNGAFGQTVNKLIQTGNSFIKLSPQLQLLDYFTPTNSAMLNAGDQDLGASGLLLIPNTNYLLGGGKQGVLYLVNTNDMGHFNSSADDVQQEFQAIYGKGTSHIHGAPVFYKSTLNGPTTYVWGENDVLRAFPFNEGSSLLNTTPLATSTMTAPVTNNDGAMPGGFLSISANGSEDGILWASTPYNGDASHQPAQGVLYAFNADTLQLLWSDKMQSTRDDIGTFAKYCPPVVANGKMYIPNWGPVAKTADGSGNLTVYGLLAATSLPTLTVTVQSASMTNGAALPALTGTVTGLTNGDTIGGTINVAYSTTATSASPSGTYPITATVTGTSAAHYQVVVTPATLTVLPATVPQLTITVQSASMTSGGPLPALTGTVTGLTNGDAVGTTIQVAYSTTATSASAAGTYPITAAVTGTSAAHYKIVVTPGTLTVVAAALPQLTVAVQNASMTSGGILPTFAGTVTGLTNGDTVGGTIKVAYSTTATSTSPAGSYPIAAMVTGTSASHYRIVVAPGTLTIISSGAGGGSSFAFANGFAGATLQLNGSAALNGTRLRLTDGNKLEASSAYYPSPINVQAFSNDFTFQLGNAQSDGFTMVIQNSGAKAIGAYGAALGYGAGAQAGIAKSLAVKFDFYSNSGEGNDSTGLFLNGATPTIPATDLTGSGLVLTSGDVMHVHATYDGTFLAVAITDTVTGKTANQNYTIDIPATVGGNTAYIGFTGGTGNGSAIQDILTWSYAPTATSAGLPSFANGFTAGLMTLNGGAALSGTKLRLLDGTTNEARSAFFPTLLNMQQFQTSFTFQMTNPSADGFAFVLQAQGSTALGGPGGSLGYGPKLAYGTATLLKSAAIKFDLYNNNGEGLNSTGLYLNGVTPYTPAIDLTPSGVNLHSGNIFSADLSYDGTTLTVVITDTVTKASAKQSYTVNLSSTLGSTSGYAGFTGGTGEVTVTTDILTWTYTPTAATAGVPIVYETISLPAVSSGPDFRQFVWTGFPSGKGTILDATKAGDQVALTVNVAKAGTYSVQVNSKQYNTRGIFQLSVDGVPGNLPGDEYYATNGGVLGNFNLGNFTMSAGNHSFVFTVAGKDAVATGYSISFGQLTLTPQ